MVRHLDDLLFLSLIDMVVNCICFLVTYLILFVGNANLFVRIKVSKKSVHIPSAVCTHGSLLKVTVFWWPSFALNIMFVYANQD